MEPQYATVFAYRVLRFSKSKKIITRLQPASRWREALEIHEILNRNNYFINKWTHEIQVIQSSITCDDVRPIKKWGFRPKKFKKSAKKSVQKRSKKRSKKGPILFLKAKKWGSLFGSEKKEGTLGPAHIYWGFENVTSACTLAENRENHRQTNRHMFWKRSGGRNKRFAQKPSGQYFRLHFVFEKKRKITLTFLL